MKRALTLLLAAALALVVFGCGVSGGDADRSAGLTGTSPALGAGSAAGEPDTGAAPDDNPIDTYFDETPYARSAASSAMSYLADQYQDAWKAEVYKLAGEIKAGLAYDADKKLVDGYVDAAEEQVTRMQDMSLFVCGDPAAPPEERLDTAGTIRGTLWGRCGGQIYKDTFFQLLGVSPYYGEGGYAYNFDPGVETSILAAALSGG